MNKHWLYIHLLSGNLVFSDQGFRGNTSKPLASVVGRSQPFFVCAPGRTIFFFFFAPFPFRPVREKKYGTSGFSDDKKNPRETGSTGSLCVAIINHRQQQREDSRRSERLEKITGRTRELCHRRAHTHTHTRKFMCVLMCRTIGGRIIYQRTAARGVCTRPRGTAAAIAFQIVSRAPLVCARAPHATRSTRRRGEAKYIFAPTFCRRRRSTPLYLYVCSGEEGEGVDPCRSDRTTGARRSLSDGLSPRPPPPNVVVATVFRYTSLRGGWFPRRSSPPPGAPREKWRAPGEPFAGATRNGRRRTPRCRIGNALLQMPSANASPCTRDIYRRHRLS